MVFHILDSVKRTNDGCFRYAHPSQGESGNGVDNAIITGFCTLEHIAAGKRNCQMRSNVRRLFNPCSIADIPLRLPYCSCKLIEVFRLGHEPAAKYGVVSVEFGIIQDYSA